MLGITILGCDEREQKGCDDRISGLQYRFNKVLLKNSITIDNTVETSRLGEVCEYTS